MQVQDRVYDHTVWLEGGTDAIRKAVEQPAPIPGNDLREQPWRLTDASEERIGRIDASDPQTMTLLFVPGEDRCDVDLSRGE